MDTNRQKAKTAKQRRYNTGRPCRHGHLCERYTQNGACVVCSKICSKKQRENREAYNEYQREYSGKNVHLLKRYLRDPGEFCFDKRTRQRGVIERATPVWADRQVIRSVYAKCVYLNETMRFPMEVDHTVPLHNRVVCGLHVPENLRIVSRTLNQQKGRKFDRKRAEAELMSWLRERGLTR